jgi:hypothetical protein
MFFSKNPWRWFYVARRFCLWHLFSYRFNRVGRNRLMVRMMEQHFIQASPIKDFAAFCALRKVLFFFGWQLFVFVGCHPSFRSVSFEK